MCDTKVKAHEPQLWVRRPLTCAYTILRKSCASPRFKNVRVPPVNVSFTTITRSKHTQSLRLYPSSGATAGAWGEAAA